MAFPILRNYFLGFLALGIFLLLLWPGRKLYMYYAENNRYAHYVLRALWEKRSDMVADGYTDQTSYATGDTQLVYLNGKKRAQAYLRLYNLEGQVVDSLQATIFPQEEGENAAVEGFHYQPSFSYTIPEQLPSGLYLWEKCAPFIVRGQQEEIAVLYPSNTIQAYNPVGGKSFYSLFSKQSPVISLQRPVFPPVSFQVHAGMHFLKQYKQYPIRYLSDQDMEKETALAGAKVLLIIGHSEYWTRQARQTFDRFIDSGGNAVILSGNTMWWQVRYDSLQQQLSCYKYQPDPEENPLLKTKTWPDSSLRYPVLPSIGVDFTYGGFGRKHEESFKGLKITNPDSPLLQDTGLKLGEILYLPTKEWDGTPLIPGPEGRKLQYAFSGFKKAELIGYDSAYDDGPGLGTFVIFQKSDSSGIVINTASMDWCSDYGLGGPDSLLLQQITRNMLEGLMEGKDLFIRQ